MPLHVHCVQPPQHSNASGLTLYQQSRRDFPTRRVGARPRSRSRVLSWPRRSWSWPWLPLRRRSGGARASPLESRPPMTFLSAPTGLASNSKTSKPRSFSSTFFLSLSHTLVPGNKHFQHSRNIQVHFHVPNFFLTSFLLIRQQCI